VGATKKENTNNKSTRTTYKRLSLVALLDHVVQRDNCTFDVGHLG
jgi:hypothetical protein